MLQRAITRKNERIERGGVMSRMLLTPQDFGVEMQTEEELNAARQEVERTLCSLWLKKTMNTHRAIASSLA